MIFHNHPQGSEKWMEARKGRATASEFKSIITPAKAALSKSRIPYMRKLARECVCSDPLEFIGNKYTDWGHTHEPIARDAFTESTGIEVHEVGFVQRVDGAPLGCSPDGLIKDGNDNWIAGLEIKCPQPDKHVDHVLEGVLPDDYKVQVHGSMAVTGLSSWWFMSYFPGLNPLIIEVKRDDYTEKVSAALEQFLKEYAEERERVFSAILPNYKPKKEGVLV